MLVITAGVVAAVSVFRHDGDNAANPQQMLSPYSSPPTRSVTVWFSDLLPAVEPSDDGDSPDTDESLKVALVDDNTIVAYATTTRNDDPEDPYGDRTITHAVVAAVDSNGGSLWRITAHDLVDVSAPITNFACLERDRQLRCDITTEGESHAVTIDPTDGSVVDDATRAQPDLADDQHLAYAIDDSDDVLVWTQTDAGYQLSRVNAVSGHQKWATGESFPEQQLIGLAPSAYPQGPYFGVREHLENFVARTDVIDADTGELVHRFNGPFYSYDDGQTWLGYVDASDSSDDGPLEKQNVHGRVLWSYGQGILMSSPSINDDLLIVKRGIAGDKARVVALDPQTGKRVWASSDSVSDDLYIAEIHGDFIVLSTLTSGAGMAGSPDAHTALLNRDTGEIRAQVQSDYIGTDGIDIYTLNTDRDGLAAYDATSGLRNWNTRLSTLVPDGADDLRASATSGRIIIQSRKPNTVTVLLPGPNSR